MAFREGSRTRFSLLAVLLAALFAVVPGSRLLAQDVPLPSQEAAPTLFPFSLGDSQANLQLSGSWSTSMSGSLGYGFDTLGGGLYPVSFPGMTEGFNFQQIPNLDISLRLLDRYFFKTSFVDTSGSQTSALPLGLNTFVLGYDGRPNEFLQSVRIGNDEVAMDSFDFLSFPAPSTSSIGASARFASGNGSYEAMVRYEPASLHRRFYVGHNEITEQRLAPGSYLDGQFFVLPDANVANVTVYIEDESGTFVGQYGHRYRKATAQDVIVSAADGTIAFREPLAGRALVYYTKNGLPVGSPSLGHGFLPAVQSGTTTLDLSASATQFSWNTNDPYISPSQPFSVTREVSIAGQPALLLYSPGEFSPFQSDNVYSVGTSLPSTNSSVSAALVPNGADSLTSAAAGTGAAAAASLLGLSDATGLRVSLDTDNQTFTVLGSSQAGSQTVVDPRSIVVRFPFNQFPDIYSGGSNRAAQDTGQQLLVRISTPVTAYQLDPNILKGSLHITRNGIGETNYTIDYASGALDFGVPIADGDVILITYRTSDSTKPGGDLLVGVGATFDLFPFLTLDIATGLRWAVFSGSYSTEADTNTGSALLNAGLHYNQNKKEGFRANLETGISLSSPDTTGTFRLFGMEGDGTTISIGEGNLFPSSLPTSGEITGAPSLTNATRGELLYNDYHLYSSGGATLQTIGWSVPTDQRYPYASGSYTGPYPVLDPSLGTVMVMDYRLSSSQYWVGAQIPLAGAPEDLSGAESISFEINSGLAKSGLTAYVQIGDIGEDLDANGKLDGSSSSVVDAFPFTVNGVALTTTGGASPKTGGTYSSEDTNANGILDLENSSLIVTQAVTVPTSPGWTKVQIDLTTDERAKLTHVNAIRIVLIDTSGSALASTLQVSSFSISQSPFHVSTTNTSPPVVQEVSDPQPAGSQLEDLYPEVKTTFHPSGATQKVLEVTWSSASLSPAWTLAGYPNPVPAGVYKRLDFYILGKSASTGSNPIVTLNLTDQNSRGIHATLPVPIDNKWHKYSLDLTSGEVYLDGSKTTSTATIDSGAAQYTVMTISSSGAAAGDIYLDEIHLSQASVLLSAGATIDASYTRSGTLVSIGSVPLLSNLSVSEKAGITGPSFASGFESNPESTTLSSFSEVDGRLPIGDLGVQFGVVHTGTRTVLSGGHSLEVPLGPFALGDSYQQTVESGQMTFSHSDQASLNAGSELSVSLQDSSTAIGSDLTQTIQSSLSASPVQPLSLSLNGTVGNQLSDFTPASTLYFTNWIDTYRLLVPVAAADATRSAALQLDSQLSFGKTHGQTHVKLDLQPQASYQSSFEASRSQTNLAGVNLSVPILTSIGSMSSLTIIPSYSRSLSSSINGLQNNGYAGDLSIYGSALSAAPYLFEGIPFEELFSPKTLALFTSSSAGQATAAYTPTVSIAGNRPSGSYLYDLFLPNSLQLSLSRDLERQADSVTDGLAWEIQYATDALNLFGTEGAYPLFRFYRTEEIAANIDVKSTSDGISSLLQNFITLYFAHHRQLEIDHRLDLAWAPELQTSDKATVTYTYRPRLTVRLPYVPKTMQQGSYLENSESVTFQTSPDTSANSYQLNFDHETAIVLPDHGQLSASAGIGVSENLISTGQRRILFGVQGSIGAQLAF